MEAAEPAVSVKPVVDAAATEEPLAMLEAGMLVGACEERSAEAPLLGSLWPALAADDVALVLVVAGGGARSSSSKARVGS
jgi:hypothetical protein